MVEPLDWTQDTPLTIHDFQQADLLRPNDVVIFQKLEGQNTAALLEWMAGIGVKTIYIDSDLPLKLRETNFALWTICASQFQARAYREAGIDHTVYIPDAVEAIKPPKTSRNLQEKLRCVWFGNWEKYRTNEVDFIQNLLTNFSNIEFIKISNSKEADIQWQLDTVFEHLHSCDFAVLPVGDESVSQAKSSNRALQAMALGLPLLLRQFRPTKR